MCAFHFETFFFCFYFVYYLHIICLFFVIFIFFVQYFFFLFLFSLYFSYFVIISRHYFVIMSYCHNIYFYIIHFTVLKRYLFLPAVPFFKLFSSLHDMKMRKKENRNIFFFLMPVSSPRPEAASAGVHYFLIPEVSEAAPPCTKCFPSQDTLSHDIKNRISLRNMRKDLRF